MALTPPTSKKTNQAGSGFTNLQRVLQANKANTLGSTVSSGIQKAGQAAQGAITKAGAEFNTSAEAEKSRLAAEQGRAARVMGDVTKATDEDVQAFEGIRGGQSKGPNTIKDASAVAEKSREAQSLGQATGNEGGRFGLLQRYIGSGDRYTGGQQRLDNMLLGQTGQADLRKARMATAGLMDKAQGTEAAASQVGQELKNRAQGLAQSTIKNLEGEVVNYDKAMDAARIKAESDRAARQAADLEQLKSGEITEEDLYNSLGLKEGLRTYGTDLSQFYTGQGKDLATKENVQTQADFDRINKLRQLSGQSLTGEASAILPAYSDASQVDAYGKIKDFNINQDALKGDIENRRQQYGQSNFGAMAHIQDALRGLYGTNISDEEHEKQLQQYGTSARENNFQRQYWAGGGYGDTALGVDSGFRNWMLDVYQNDPRYMGNEVYRNQFNKTFGALKKPPTE